MTAINILVQEQDVHLITDGGTWDANGRFAGAISKVFCLAHLNAAIAIRGSSIGLPLVAHMMGVASSYDDAKARAVVQLRAAVEFSDVMGRKVFPNDDFRRMQLFVVGWSEQTGPDAYAVQTEPGGGCPAWTVCQIAPSCSLNPMNESIRVAVEKICNGRGAWDMDPRIDGLKIIEAQRRGSIEDSTVGPHIVGGYAQLTTVRRQGITTEVLKRWPDVVGLPIQPDAPATFGLRRKQAYAAMIGGTGLLPK